MINRLGPIADAEAVEQRGRSLTAGYAVKRLSASLSPRDRRESARAVPRGADRARSALSASTPREHRPRTRSARNARSSGEKRRSPLGSLLGGFCLPTLAVGWRREKNGSSSWTRSSRHPKKQQNRRNGAKTRQAKNADEEPDPALTNARLDAGQEFAAALAEHAERGAVTELLARPLAKAAETDPSADVGGGRG